MSLVLCGQAARAGGIADADAGIARLNAGDAAAAVELFTRAIQSRELSPERQALTYHHRGMARHQEGQAGAAILDYTTALWSKGLPRDFKPRTLNNRGLSYESINDFDSAMRDYNLALRMNDHYAEAYCSRGNLHRRFGRHELAIADYDMALRNDHPHPKYVFLWQGLSLEGLGKRREAMDAFRRALTIDPSFALAKSNLARLEDSQALNNVLGRRKATKVADAPSTDRATPGQQASAISTEAELNAAPWTPPPPKAPAIIKVEAAPPPQPESGLSLRPAFDDQPKGGQAAAAAPVSRVEEPKIAPAAVPVSPSTSLQNSSNGEGGSDIGYSLQLGSFKSQSLAESGWSAVLKIAGDLLDGLSHAVEAAPVQDKGTMYRLYAEALPDRQAALGLCRTLRDKGTPCIVVRR